MAAPASKEEEKLTLSLMNLKDRDRKLMEALLDTDVKIKVAIPDDATSEDIYRNLTVACRMIGAVESARARLWPVLGRLLRICKERPEVYQSRGHKNFDAFLGEVDSKLNVPRSECYKMMGIVRDWPNLTMEQYSKVGPGKFSILRSMQASQDHSDWKKLISTAETKSVSEFREWAEEKGFVSSGQTIPCRVTIATSVEIAREWKEWVERADVQEYFGSANAGEILRGMLSECSTEIGHRQNTKGLSNGRDTAR